LCHNISNVAVMLQQVELLLFGLQLCQAAEAAGSVL
jgi:hypothetical protein